ncbi:antirestriction protein ArdA, partial [Escherichia coli]|uniref:antirestriction protein ArdA n=1 Tax=Escherichia coli TaxID=562 RepID=UPI00235FA760
MSVVAPAVYVGTWHKYNCGSIAGRWFDLTTFDDERDFFAACRALHQDETDPELMFQDYEVRIPLYSITDWHRSPISD